MAARKSNSVVRAATLLHVLADGPVDGVVARRDRPPGRPELRQRALDRERARGERSRAPPFPHPRLHARSRAHRARRGGAPRLPRRRRRAPGDGTPLATTSGLGCLASARVGDDMLMLAVTGPPQPFGSRVQVGERVPIAPPLGLAFIAWADAATIEDYLDSSGRRLTAAERRQYAGCTRARARTRVRRGARQLDPSPARGAPAYVDRSRRLPSTSRARRDRSSSSPSTTTRCSAAMRGRRVRGDGAHRAGLRARRRRHPRLDRRRVRRSASGRRAARGTRRGMFEATSAIQAAMTDGTLPRTSPRQGSET